MMNTALKSGTAVTRWIGFTVETIPSLNVTAFTSAPVRQPRGLKTISGKTADPDADSRHLEWEILPDDL